MTEFFACVIFLKAVRRLARRASSSVGAPDSGVPETVLEECEVEWERHSAAEGEESREDSFLSYDEEEYAKDTLNLMKVGQS